MIRKVLSLLLLRKDLLLKKKSPWLLAVFSGILGFLGYVGFNQFYLEWVFMVPLLVAIRDKTPGRAFFLGWVTGIVGYAGGFYWFTHMLTVFVGLNFFFAGIGLLVFAAFNGLTFAIFAWALKRLQLKKGWSVWWMAPVIWAAIENIYPFLFPNYIGASQYMLLPLIQIADITGILGISFLVVWCNATVFTVMESRLTGSGFPLKKVSVFAAVILLTGVYGLVRMDHVDAAVAKALKLKMVMIQAGEGGIAKHEDPWRFLNLHQDLTRAAVLEPSIADADLVIWPESVLTTPISRKSEQLPDKLFKEMGKPVLFGTYSAERQGGKIKNYVSAVMVDEELRVKGLYDKQVLVPFGEYIPLGDLYPVLYQRLPYTTRFWPGNNIEPFVFKDYRFQINLCYEDLFPNLIHQNMISGVFFGKEMPHAIINLTNDSWYGDTFEPLQHLVNASFRAIEHRRPLVRSTNTGISAFVDPVGRLEKRTAQWTREIIADNVPMMTGRTIYSYAGNWLGGLSLLITLVLIGLSYKGRKQKT